jgi:predicted GNAT family acetyltransferase
MEQTAVEWLVSQLNKKGFAQVVTDEEINQAKEMEKEQMNCTWEESRFNHWGDDYLGKQISFNEYYNETFKSE